MKSFLMLLQLLVVGALIFFGFAYLIVNQGLQWEHVWIYRQAFLYGWLITIVISIGSLACSVIIGFIAALMKRSSISLLNALARVYVELIRGTPLLVQILFFFYVIAYKSGLDNRYIAGVLVLSFFHGAYIAEIIRSGIDNISITQLQSAEAIGLSKFQCYRFVILPQTIRQVLPPLAGQFSSIIKDSSLLSIIGISEVTNIAQQINSATYSTLESYLPLAIAYLILTMPISFLSKQLEKRFRYET